MENYDEEKMRRRKAARRRKRRNALIVKSVILVVLIVVLVVAIWALTGGLSRSKNSTSGPQSSAEVSSVSADSQGTDTGTVPSAEAGSQDSSEAPADTGAQVQTSTNDLVLQAQALATQYDYDGAINLLKSDPGYEQNAEMLSYIADYETAKSNLVATSPFEVTHIFFHSLVVDPARGFSLTGDSAWDTATAGFCEWMTTVYEFDQIMQQMYDRGYVLISLYDMVDITTDENGVEHVAAKNIYLPQGKTPFVLSLDDTCYYHSYNGRGTATRLIIGDDGTPTCEYVDADGNTLVGSYDCIPRLDDFIDAHPDFSYKGAKGTIALTGYNGILGYRTDFTYRDRVDLSEDQQAWLDANPGFNWDAECAQAKAVADCIKADGWTFASHTWGHIRIGDADLGWIQEDTEKWQNYVAPLVGGSDIVIFAHGQDLASWNEEYSSTDKFRYMKDQGFTIFCNVDSSQYFVQIGDEYLRMGRRNLDGYRLWQSVYGGSDKLNDLIDAATVFDPARPTDESLYSL